LILLKDVANVDCEPKVRQSNLVLEFGDEWSIMNDKTAIEQCQIHQLRDEIMTAYFVNW